MVLKRFSLAVFTAVSALAATQALAAGVGDVQTFTIGGGVGQTDGGGVADMPLKVIDPDLGVEPVPGDAPPFVLDSKDANLKWPPVKMPVSEEKQEGVDGEIRTMSANGNVDKNANSTTDMPLPVAGAKAAARFEELRNVMLERAEERANWRPNRPAMSGSNSGGGVGNHFGQIRNFDNGNRFGQTRTLPSRPAWPTLNNSR